MYDARARILSVSSLVVLGVIVARLASLQLGSDSAIKERITQLKDQRGRSEPLKTKRGRILDRNGRVLAQDDPVFKLKIRYDLSCFLDERVQRAMRLAATQSRPSPEKALEEANRAIDTNLAVLDEVIAKCSRFVDPCDEVVRAKIQRYNDRIWNLRTFQAWRKNCTQSEFYKRNADHLGTVDIHDVLEDFEKVIPDPNRRLALAAGAKIVEMKGSSPLVELKTDNDFVAAQLEFIDVDGISIAPEPVRVYPFKTAAAQTIGWVGETSQVKDRQLFADDPYACYLEGEDCGREDGVEYVCEAVLRGRRGKEVHDIDGTLIHRVAKRLGEDVHLTIDIELQAKIEQTMLTSHAPYCGPGMAAVVMDVASGDVLAMISLPLYDLNDARYHFGRLASDPNQPLFNRVLSQHYEPGSVVKPIILVAGLQTGAITPEKVIPCPAAKAPAGWPSCWVFRQERIGHDDRWSNYARNAIKGSCNIYFSRLAMMIDPRALQEWAFAFGYGRQADFAYPVPGDSNDSPAPAAVPRRLRQWSGQISSRIERGAWVRTMDQIPPLDPRDRVLVGIGEGQFSATPIQVVGAMAALARGGFYKPPRLFLPKTQSSSATPAQEAAVDLGLTEQTRQTVLDGMYAVVNEERGTAAEGFSAKLPSFQGLRIYGKTGSTERPENAWFAGFAVDHTGRKVALALVVEGGKSGGRDAAPLGCDIIELCLETGHLSR